MFNCVLRDCLTRPALSEYMRGTRRLGVLATPSGLLAEASFFNNVRHITEVAQ
jgi:hypothetical protein